MCIGKCVSFVAFCLDFGIFWVLRIGGGGGGGNEAWG